MISIPTKFAHATGTIGDWMNLGPISRQAVNQLGHGVLATPSTANTARGFTKILRSRPAGTQDLWHARLYLMRPAIQITLAFMWALSAWIGLTADPASFLPSLGATLPDWLLIFAARGGGVADLFLAIAVFFGFKRPLVIRLQIALVLAYTIGLSVIETDLWLLPFGGLLKNLPILILLWISLILEDER